LNQRYATAGDNGPFKGFKFSLFDGGMHVPALVHWPGRVKRGQVISELTMSMDILPTICEASGAPIPGGIDGASVLNVLTKSAKSPHEALFWNQGGQLAVRKGRWKLVLNGRLFDRRPDGQNPLPGDDAVWLSGLEKDPGESRNLRHMNPNIADELSTLAYSWQATLKDKK
jgi:arylsulfatase A-like enzyme